MSYTNWDGRLLALAQHIGRWSKDPSTQVGAVITDPQRRIVSVGYNGFPAGVEDRFEWLNDRETKYALTIHAETNAILFASRDISDCTLYTWPFMPCRRCATLVIQKGITRVVAPVTPDDLQERWGVELKASYDLLRHSGVNVDLLL